MSRFVYFINRGSDSDILANDNSKPLTKVVLTGKQQALFKSTEDLKKVVVENAAKHYETENTQKQSSENHGTDTDASQSHHEMEQKQSLGDHGNDAIATHSQVVKQPYQTRQQQNGKKQSVYNKHDVHCQEKFPTIEQQKQQPSASKRKNNQQKQKQESLLKKSIRSILKTKSTDTEHDRNLKRILHDASLQQTRNRPTLDAMHLQIVKQLRQTQQQEYEKRQQQHLIKNSNANVKNQQPVKQKQSLSKERDHSYIDLTNCEKYNTFQGASGFLRLHSLLEETNVKPGFLPSNGAYEAHDAILNRTVTDESAQHTDIYNLHVKTTTALNSEGEEGQNENFILAPRRVVLEDEHLKVVEAYKKELDRSWQVTSSKEKDIVTLCKEIERLKAALSSKPSEKSSRSKRPTHPKHTVANQAERNKERQSEVGHIHDSQTGAGSHNDEDAMENDHTNESPAMDGHVAKPVVKRHYMDSLNAPDHVDRPVRDKVCKECGKAFTSTYNLKKHGRWHDPEFVKRKAEMGSRYDFTKVYKCSECPKEFISFQRLRNHEATHRVLGCGTELVLPEREKNFKCDGCDKWFKCKRAMRSHWKIHSDATAFICEVCSKRFATRQRLTFHSYSHTGERPFKCRYCEKGFVRKTELKYHENDHTGYRPFKCEFCESTFAEKSKLTRHKRVHLGDSPFVCSTCGRGFRRAAVLRIHEDIHRGTRNFLCNTCGKSFVFESALRAHYLTHNRNRSYECMVCEKVLSSTTKLKLHMKIHIGSELFYCGICKETFQMYVNYKKHIQTHDYEIFKVQKSNTTECDDAVQNMECSSEKTTITQDMNFSGDLVTAVEEPDCIMQEVVCTFNPESIDVML